VLDGKHPTRPLAVVVQERLGVRNWNPNGVVGGHFIYLDQADIDVENTVAISSGLTSRAILPPGTRRNVMLGYFLLNYYSEVPGIQTLHELAQLEAIGTVRGFLPVLLHGHPKDRNIEFTAWCMTDRLLDVWGIYARWIHATANAIRETGIVSNPFDATGAFDLHEAGIQNLFVKQLPEHFSSSSPLWHS
jgi:hypothetical protein